MPLVLRLLLEVLCEILKEMLTHLSGQLILLGAMETPMNTAGCRDKLHLRTALPGAEVALGLISYPDSHNFVTARIVGSRGCY